MWWGRWAGWLALCLAGCDAGQGGAPAAVQERRSSQPVSAITAPRDGSCEATFTLVDGLCIHDGLAALDEAERRSVLQAYRRGAAPPVVRHGRVELDRWLAPAAEHRAASEKVPAARPAKTTYTILKRSESAPGAEERALKRARQVIDRELERERKRSRQSRHRALQQSDAPPVRRGR